MAAGAPHVTLAAGSDAACLPSQPFMTSAKPHHVPKTPPPNTLLLKVGVPHMNLGGPRASCRVLVVKNLPANAGNTGDPRSIPGLGRSSGGGNSNPLQYSWLENPMDRGDWWATIHSVTKNQTQLSMHEHTWEAQK